MKKQELDNLMTSLGDLSSPAGAGFNYHRDEYALLLLGWSLDRPRKVHELKRSPYGRLLKKPGANRVLAHASGGMVCPEDFVAYGPRGARYALSLGRWGDHDCDDPGDLQLTRRGENLVVHVNFPAWHDAEYRRLVDPDLEQPFAFDSHPRAEQGLTMSWARVDVDLHHGQALIEEIQSDWIRYAIDAYQDARGQVESQIEVDGLTVSTHAMIEYYETVLRPHARIWSELTLCATLWILRERLGIRDVWFHTFDGSRLKGEDCDPPRHLYSDLPRKFCFARTREAPHFLNWKDSPQLKQSLGPGAKKPVDWFRLSLN